MNQQTFVQQGVENLNAIASNYGGWKNGQMPTQCELHGRFMWLRMEELRLNKFAEMACDGGSRELSAELKNRNVNFANEVIDISRESIPNVMAKWFNDEKKFREQFFINTDPRGYALKLDLTPEEQRKCNIYRDWGGYGILAPENFE